MCGRYTLHKPQAVLRAFQVKMPATGLFTERYNVAPTQLAPVVRAGADSGAGGGAERALVMMRWGLVPSWASDLAIGNRMINARGETLGEKPAFRRLVSKRRCLVPVTGYYEWSKDATPKQPYHFTLPDAEVFGLAGLWDCWAGPEGPVESYTIITTTPNEIAATVHDRMPVIVSPGDYDAWLNPQAGFDAVQRLIAPYPGAMTATPVSRIVNSPANDRPECIRESP